MLFEKLDALLDKAINELRHSPRETLPTIHYARKLAHQHGYTPGLARAFLAEATAELLLSNYDAATTCLQSFHQRNRRIALSLRTHGQKPSPKLAQKIATQSRY